MALIDKLSAIGDAIREKSGKDDLLTLDQMPIEIKAIETGGGELPEEVFNISGNCSYRFANNGWNWFVENYGNKITTKDISTANNMFMDSSELERIPFKLNFSDDVTTGKSVYALFLGCHKLKQIDYDIDIGSLSSYVDSQQIFSQCYLLKSVPYIYNLYPSNINSLFNHCYSLRYVPDDYINTWNLSRLLTYAYASVAGLFNNCYSLRKAPEWLIQFESTKTTSAYSIIYCNLFVNNYSLDEIIDLPVLQMTWTSNAFAYSPFRNCFRLKNMTFRLNDDETPCIVQWNNQIVNLTESVGYANSIDVANILNYNSGITEDKKVYDDTTYQALKNDPDWFTTDIAYSRYNHDSAVNTINSLPDTSAYGTNTIKFKGNAGSATDGGAINTLTEEEIAVAAAKGWTVSFV